MEEITLTSNTGAYLVLNQTGGSFVYKNGLPAYYETSDGSGIMTSGKYYLLKFDGSNVKINPYTTEGYNQHGSTLHTVLLGQRTITIKALICASPEGFFANSAKFFYDIRQKIFDIGNPITGEITVLYKNDYGVKKINALMTQMPTEDKDYGTGREYNITLTATDPFWTDEYPEEVLLQKATGGLKFPFKHDASTGAIFGSLQTTKDVTYLGNAPTGVTVTITAENTCVNPLLTCVNSDGTQYVGIIKTLAANDVFKITTGYGEKKVYYNGTNAMRYLKSGSKFFSLQPGSNILTMSATSGNCIIKVEYYNNYVNP